jgi:hypothetical protein
VTTEDILFASRLTWIYVNSFDELMQTSVHTFLRESTDIAALHALMQGGTGQGLFSPVAAPINIQKTVLSQWAGGPGFTGWHGYSTSDVSLSWGTGDLAPPQLACVVGVRNDEEFAIAIGRRRNRSYIGPIRSSSFSTDGRFTDATRDTIKTAFQTFSTALRAIPSANDDNSMDGLAVVSPTEGVIMPGTQVFVGRGVDTLRSRRQKVSEAMEAVNLTHTS